MGVRLGKRSTIIAIFFFLLFFFLLFFFNPEKEEEDRFSLSMVVSPFPRDRPLASRIALNHRARSTKTHLSLDTLQQLVNEED